MHTCKWFVLGHEIDIFISVILSFPKCRIKLYFFCVAVETVNIDFGFLSLCPLQLCRTDCKVDLGFEIVRYLKQLHVSYS